MNKFKNFRLISCFILALFLTAAFFNPAQAARKPAPTISAAGSSVQEFLPDTGYVTLAVETQAATASEAQTQNARIANRVLSQILSFGVNEKDIKTIGYSVSPVYENTEPGTRRQPTVIGYRAVNTMSVYVEADKTGPLIDLALKSGATQIINVRFSLKDSQKAAQETLALAVTDAVGKLEAIANALGKKIVRIQSVNEINTSSRAAMMDARMYSPMAANESSDSTPISQGTVTISSSVQVTAEIE
jgi:uncharacterized protein YggE